MSETPAPPSPNRSISQEQRLRPTLSTRKIVIMVVAAAAPLAALVGTVPLAFAIGDGPGVPAMFLFAGVTLLCFSVGYAAMSRRIVNAGGFYTYVSSGLGRPPAVGAGLVAVLSYNTATVGMVGTFAYFTELVGDQAGLHLRWEWWAALSIAAMAVLGYRQIDFSARVLQILLVGEIGILLLLDIAVIVRHGGGAMPATSFAPHTVFGAGAGVTVMFAFASFIGFESAALYGEESRNPKRSVPLATYISVITITVFYAFTSWIAVGAIGPSHLRKVAGKQLGDMFFRLSDDYLDKSVTSVMAILLCTSLFAGVLALHNAANRYMYVLGRERVLPGGLDAIHPKYNAPHRASLVQTTLTVVLVAVFAIAGLDPYVNLATSMLGIGTLGIVVLQAAAALSVVGFFRNRPDRHWWRTGLAPLLGFVGLTVSVVLLVENFSVLTGTDNPVVHALPWLLVAATVGGVLYGLWIRSARPERYAGLARTEVRDTEPHVETTTVLRPAPAVVPPPSPAAEGPSARTGNQ